MFFNMSVSSKEHPEVSFNERLLIISTDEALVSIKNVMKNL